MRCAPRSGHPTPTGQPSDGAPAASAAACSTVNTSPARSTCDKVKLNRSSSGPSASTRTAPGQPAPRGTHLHGAAGASSTDNRAAPPTCYPEQTAGVATGTWRPAHSSPRNASASRCTSTRSPLLKHRLTRVQRSRQQLHNLPRNVRCCATACSATRCRSTAGKRIDVGRSTSFKVRRAALLTALRASCGPVDTHERPERRTRTETYPRSRRRKPRLPMRVCAYLTGWAVLGSEPVTPSLSSWCFLPTELTAPMPPFAGVSSFSTACSPSKSAARRF